jgi:Family of unknown function (DUF6221)
MGGGDHPMMNDLITYLRAQFDNDEQAAQATEAGDWDGDRSILDARTGRYIAVGPYGCDMDQEDVAQIVRWDPKRVLVEVDAKRCILELCVGRLFDDDGQPRFDDGWSRELVDARYMLRFLAMPYAGHSDYDPAWAIEHKTAEG